MAIKDYKDLTAWQKAMQLAVEVYRLTRLLPKEESFGLIGQLPRMLFLSVQRSAEC